MLFSLVILARKRLRGTPPSWFLADQEKSSAFGTGSWTDTSPQTVMCARCSTRSRSTSTICANHPNRRNRGV
jgi:hypothetical protein